MPATPGLVVADSGGEGARAGLAVVCLHGGKPGLEVVTAAPPGRGHVPADGLLASLAGGRGRYRWAWPRLPGRYGVIAMAMGCFPTAMALPVVLVAVRIGVTVPEPVLTT